MTTTTDERLSDLTGLGAREGGDKHYFAEIAIIDDYDCVLERGRGKIPFDPTFHRPEQRRVNISMTLICTKQDGSSYDLKQDDITSGSKHKLTLASLEALGVVSRSQLKALPGTFAEVVRVPTGQKYAAKKDSADGAIKAGDMLPEQALKFLALFPDADACKAAEAAFYTPRNGDSSAKNAPQAITSQELGSSPVIDQAARASLLATLPVLWAAAQQNESMFASFLTNNPGYAAAGLTLNSDEVQTAIGKIIPF